MAANCAQLRQSLAHLQSQLNVLTNKQQQTTPEEPPKQEKKKSKSKKSKDKKAASEKPDIKDDEVKESDQNQVEQVTNDPTEVKEVVDKQNEVEQVINEQNDEVIEEINIQNDIDSDKVDDKTLENLIQAINNANINLCDLEVVNDDNDLDDPSDVLNEILKDVELSNGPKIIELTDEDILKLEAKEKSSNENSTHNEVDDKILNLAESNSNKTDSCLKQIEKESVLEISETSHDKVELKEVKNEV